MSDWVSGLLGGLGEIAGAGINAGMQNKINKDNIELQERFAQNGIQWKVQDAKKAGIHPAVALGAQTYEASPSSVAPNVGSGVGKAFKHFGSAIDSYIEDKSDERKLQLERMKLENEKERLEIAKMKNPNTESINPNAYFSRTGLDGVPNNKKLIFGSDKIGDDVTLTRTRNGDVIFTPSDNVSEYVSESFIGSAGWHSRNYTPDLDDNIYSDYHNRLVQSGMMNPLKEGLVHSWSPINGNTYKIVPLDSKEWKDFVKYGKYTPLGVMKKIKNLPDKIEKWNDDRNGRLKSFFKRYGNPYKKR